MTSYDFPKCRLDQLDNNLALDITFYIINIKSQPNYLILLFNFQS